METSFSGIAESEAMLQLRYQNGFGNLPPGTVYMDYTPELKGQKAVDLLPEIKKEWYDRQPAEFKAAIQRAVETKAALTTASPLFAIGTTYSATSGSIPVLLPTQVDSQLYDRTRREYPLATGLLPRVTQMGIFADIIRRTALPTAKFKSEGAALDTATSTYGRAVTTVKFMYATGEITGPMLLASRVWQEALALETEAQFRALKDLEEDCIINGNPTSGDTGGTTTDNTAFTGFANLVTTNTNNKSSAKISLDDLRVAFQVIREARGEPDLIVTDWKTLNDVKALLTESVRYLGPGDVKTLDFGILTIVFEGVPIVPDLLMPTSANARELHIWTVKKGNNAQMRVLQESTLEELAKTSDAYKFTVKQYVTLLIAHENWCYRIYNLA